MCVDGTFDWERLDALAGKWNARANEEARSLFGSEGDLGDPFVVKDKTLGEALVSRTQPRVRRQQATAWLGRRLAEFGFYFKQATTRTLLPKEVQYISELAVAFQRRCGCKRWQKELGLAWAYWEEVVALIDRLLGTSLSLLMLGYLDPGASQHVADLCVWFSEEAKRQEDIVGRWDDKEARESWSRFVDAAYEKGAGLAHRMTKPVAAMPLERGVDEEGQASTLPQHQLKEQLQFWSGWWRSDAADDVSEAMNAEEWSAEPLLEVPSVEEIRKASASFRVATSAPDGWSPRQVGYLSEGAVRCLAVLMSLCEAGGNFPRRWQSLVTALLPKPKGGTRPIGLFRCMFRLWSKVRQHHARAWVDSLGDKARHFTMLPGRRCSDAVWRSQV